MSVIFLSNRIVHYEALGRGRPLLFLHGWIGSWRYWIPAMQASSTAYRSYALDLWGFGDTSRAHDSYSPEQQADLVEAFMQSMGIAKLALIGHGLGALAALAFARRSPALVDRVMAVNCPMAARSINSRLRTDPLPALADWLAGKDPASEPVRVDAPKADPQAVAASFSALDQTGVAESAMLDEVPIPCLFVHGLADPAISPPPDARLDQLPSRFHFIALEQSGHFPMLDESPRFNRLLADFLALDSGLSPRELQLKDEWKRRVR
ncbi:MAG: alpha/beta hydrolase [Chloroflexi bacterium]|nr:alpha/beta hydrolase [Chloroflexota bacterium]